MASNACFNELPDLFFIELFTYLSSLDVLWSFSDLTPRLQRLVRERGFFRYINLSSAHLFQFDTLLARLPIHEIETVVVNVEASPLQLGRFCHLPHLTTLRVYGLRDFDDARTFILRHSQTLTHLTLETNFSFTFAAVSAMMMIWHGVASDRPDTTS